MIVTHHRTADALTAEEKHYLRERKVKGDACVAETLVALNSLISLHPISRNLQDVIDVLRREPREATPVRNRGRSARCTVSTSIVITTARSTTGGSATGRATLARSLRLAQHQRHAAVREEQHRFTISPNRPLLLSYQAQLDRCYATGERRRGSLGLVSSLAPLFSRNSKPMTEEEKRKLAFLTPPRESPKEQTLRALEERHQYDRHCDPNAKVRYNEPKHLPNLNQKVAPDFTPVCAAKQTYSTQRRFSGNGDRVTRVRAADESARRTWRC